MASTPKHVLVIGGGITGAASAYALRRADCAVTLVDKGIFGKGCSHGNCGFVSPSHVLPLNVPGAVAKTLKFALRSNSAFRIAPRLDPGLWLWLIRFALNCTNAKALPAGFARKALIESSTQLYKEFCADEKLDCEWEDRGCLFVQQTKAGFQGYSKYVKTLQDTFQQAGWEAYEGEALVHYEPALKPGVAAGAWLFKGDAHMRPSRLMECYKTALNRHGVMIQENTGVTGLRFENGRVVAAQTETGDLAADAIVVACGAWTPQLNRSLGFRVPIQPGKGYSITMSRPKICPVTPLIFQDHKVAITPFRSGYRIGSLMEFAGYNEKLEPRRLQLLRDGASIYLREPFGESVEEEWWGWRPMTNDGLPIIGAVPRASNLFIAAGHNMEGMCMGAATGKMVMELVTGQKPHLDPLPFSPARF